MIYVLALAALVASPAWAGKEIPDAEAVSWLQRVSNAARNLPYEGVFVMQMGDSMKTIQVENHANGPSSTSRLVVLDGKQREIRCYRNESITLVWDAKGRRLERRLGSRHFPDLLPPDVAPLTDSYTLSVGGIDRVAGQACRLLELKPKDEFRWGYVLCADELTGLPLKATMVDTRSRMLVRYAFTNIRKGATSKAEPELPRIAPTDEMRPLDHSMVNVNRLPPGYQRVAAATRTLPKRGEVEHRVFSDGLSYISMFVEPAPRNVVSMKGQGSRGMMNMYTRKLGAYKITVLGDAPWPAVQTVATNLSLR